MPISPTCLTRRKNLTKKNMQTSTIAMKKAQTTTWTISDTRKIIWTRPLLTRKTIKHCLADQSVVAHLMTEQSHSDINQGDEVATRDESVDRQRSGQSYFKGQSGNGSIDIREARVSLQNCGVYSYCTLLPLSFIKIYDFK